MADHEKKYSMNLILTVFDFINLFYFSESTIFAIFRLKTHLHRNLNEINLDIIPYCHPSITPDDAHTNQCNCLLHYHKFVHYQHMVLFLLSKIPCRLTPLLTQARITLWNHASITFRRLITIHRQNKNR